MKFGIRSSVCLLVCWLALSAQTVQSPGLARKGLDVDRTINFLLDEDQLLPASLSLPEGRYRFILLNSFTTARLDLRVDDDKSSRLANLEMKALSSRGELVLELKKGRHTIYVAQRPRWRTTIDVIEVKK